MEHLWLDLKQSLYLIHTYMCYCSIIADTAVREGEDTTLNPAAVNHTKPIFTPQMCCCAVSTHSLAASNTLLYVHTHTCEHAHTHTHTHTHRHTCTHTHLPTHHHPHARTHAHAHKTMMASSETLIPPHVAAVLNTCPHQTLHLTGERGTQVEGDLCRRGVSM